MSKECAVGGCLKEAVSRGMCSAHYHRLMRYGDPEFVPPRKPPSICAVDGCTSQVGRSGGRGFCRKHYKRLLDHGDPLGGGTGKGDVIAFLDAAINRTEDECLIFPFARDSYGYARVNIGGNNTPAHSYVCEKVKGQKPSPLHEVLHSCGNGANGCVSGNHLSWGTRKENVADAIEHGTAKFWGRPCTGAANDNVPASERSVAV